MTDFHMALRALVRAWLPVCMAVMATGVGAASPDLPVNAIQASPLAQAVPGSAPAAVPAVQAVATVQSGAPMSTGVQARWDHIAVELRCLVCQNETIAASHADLAVDLRSQIRIKLAQGQTSQQILDFMVERYGDFVLYRPPLKPMTLLLWVGPFALLLLAAGVLALNVRRLRRSSTEALSPAELQRARQLLDQGGRPP